MFDPVTVEEARTIAANHKWFPTAEALAFDVLKANEYAGQPMEANTSEQYRADFRNSYRMGGRDPRETLNYWYVQVAQDIRADQRQAAYDAGRLY